MTTIQQGPTVFGNMVIVLRSGQDGGIFPLNKTVCTFGRSAPALRLFFLEHLVESFFLFLLGIPTLISESSS